MTLTLKQFLLAKDTQLGAYLGKPPDAIWRWSNGHHGIRMDMAVDCAAQLGISVDEFNHWMTLRKSETIQQKLAHAEIDELIAQKQGMATAGKQEAIPQAS